MVAPLTQATWHRRRRLASRFVASLAVVVAATWGTLALAYQGPGGLVGKIAANVAWSSFGVATLVAVWRGRGLRELAIFVVAFALLLLWWSRIAPSNARDFADEVAQITNGTVDGNDVTMRNVRNFDWHSDTDYTPRWETRHYALDHLSGVDMILSYWSGHAIAHMLVSFGFEDGTQVAFSVEIRREKTEKFSELGGFFKEFELSVIAADERDVIRVRTNIRGEDDYLYRVAMPKADMRALFLAYIDEANQLVSTPRFYDTVTTNCTTLVYHMMNGIVGHLPLDYRLLLSGYLPEYVYRVGGLDARYPLEELRERGRITDRAKRSDRSTTFSADIRAGIPPLAATN